MAASVATTWGPGFVVGVRRPAAFVGRTKVSRPRSAPPMRRRFEVEVPEALPPVSRRARRVERPEPGTVRVRPRARRARARSARFHPPVASSRIRLTRRGRVLAFVLVAVAVYAAFGLGRASAGGPPVHARPTAVVVQPGDSLWSIAQKEFPNSDPRDVVGQLRSLNHLSNANVLVGQKLRLP